METTEKTVKKRGRPATGLKRDKNVSFRLTNDEYNILRDKAEKSGLSVNKYCYEKIFKNHLA